jgi:hypothetical protein
VRARPFLKTPAGIAVLGSVVMVLGATIFFYRQFAEEKAAALLEGPVVTTRLWTATSGLP